MLVDLSEWLVVALLPSADVIVNVRCNRKDTAEKLETWLKDWTFHTKVFHDPPLIGQGK
jgi:hypothetical protein